MRATTALLVRGFGYSGSGLVTDLLSEYSSVATVHGEFDDFRRFGMVGDHVVGRIDAVFPSRIRMYAAQRLAPLARRTRLAVALGNLKRRLVGLPMTVLPERANILRDRYLLLLEMERSLSAASDHVERLEVAVTWLDELIGLYSSGRPFVLFDQPLVHSAHDEVWPRVFAPFVLLEIFRDPRDQLADLYRSTVGRERGQLDFGHQDRIELERGRERFDIMQDLADGIRRRLSRADIGPLPFEPGLGHAYRISFERLLRDPASSIQRLEDLLGLNAVDRTAAGTRFIPEASRRNLGIHQSILRPEERELVADLVPMTERWALDGPL